MSLMRERMMLQLRLANAGQTVDDPVQKVLQFPLASRHGVDVSLLRPDTW